MPRPNRGTHLWLDPRTGYWNLRWFESGQRRMLSTRCREHEQAIAAIGAGELAGRQLETLKRRLAERRSDPLAPEHAAALVEEVQRTQQKPPTRRPVGAAGRLAYLRGSFVYVIGWQESGPLKIGVAKDPLERALNLQTGCPYPLRVLASYRIGRDVFFSERCFHKALAPYKLTGEWFAVALSTVDDLASEHLKTVDAMLAANAQQRLIP